MTSKKSSKYSALAKDIEDAISNALSENKREVKLSMKNKKILLLLKDCCTSTNARDIIRRALSHTTFEKFYRTEFDRNDKYVTIRIIDAYFEQNTQAQAQVHVAQDAQVAHESSTLE